MSKRRLNQQQTRRVRAQRQRAVDQSTGDGELKKGLVIARYGKQVTVESEDGTRIRCHQRANLEALVAGDRVVWQETDDGGVVVAMEPRSSALERPDLRGKLRPVAANIDLMLIVIAPKPEPFANLVDRYLVAAALSDIDAALVLNKADLLEEDDQLLALLEAYRSIGYEGFLTGGDIDTESTLGPIIKDKTLVFVGQSGVGKSSLIGKLMPDLDIRVGELSDAKEKGRHTTTTAELYHLPSGADLIDSPGIREFHLSHIEPDKVIYGFKEFEPFLGGCKFRDCRHREEKECAIKAAVETGEISEVRFNSYRQIVEALENPD